MVLGITTLQMLLINCNQECCYDVIHETERKIRNSNFNKKTSYVESTNKYNL